jgi:hypothetical protein
MFCGCSLPTAFSISLSGSGPDDARPELLSHQNLSRLPKFKEQGAYFFDDLAALGLIKTDHSFAVRIKPTIRQIR